MKYLVNGNLKRINGFLRISLIKTLRQILAVNFFVMYHCQKFRHADIGCGRYPFGIEGIDAAHRES